MPEISIIIPVYKVEKYLCKCVDSVLNQAFSDFEIILIDDGSPDNCPKICDEYAEKDSRIKVIHQQNSGVSSARNKGIEASHGKYLWFIDSDDEIIPNAFDIIHQFIELDFDVLVLKDIPDSDCDFEEGFINSKKYTVVADPSKKDKLMERAHSGNVLPYAWNKIFKASFIKENNIFFNKDLKYGEDSVFDYEALFLAKKIVFFKEKLYIYSQRDDAASKTIGKNFGYDFVNELERNCEAREAIINQYCSESKKACYEDESQFVLKTIFFILLLGRLYKSNFRNKYRAFKNICSRDFIKKAFQRFDINTIKSNSLDWWMFWAVKHKLYFAGHLICKYILFK